MRSLNHRMLAEASGCEVTKRMCAPSGEVPITYVALLFLLSRTEAENNRAPQ